MAETWPAQLLAAAADLDVAISRMIAMLRAAQSDVRRVKANVDVLVKAPGERSQAVEQSPFRVEKRSFQQRIVGPDDELSATVTVDGSVLTRDGVEVALRVNGRWVPIYVLDVGDVEDVDGRKTE